MENHEKIMENHGKIMEFDSGKLLGTLQVLLKRGSNCLIKSMPSVCQRFAHL